MSAPVTPAKLVNRFSEEEIAAAEGEYRRVAVINGKDDAYAYILKPAPRFNWKQFRGHAGDDAKKADAQERLVVACVVAVKYAGRTAKGTDESRKLFNELLEDFTSAADGKRVSEAIFDINGSADEGN